MFSRHEKFAGAVQATAADAFALLDDQPRLSKHMNKRSWKMGWGKMNIIGAYRMGFEIAPSDAGAQLRVSIDYELPSGGMSRLLGRAFGRSYARWCTRQMVLDAQSSLGSGAAHGHAA